MRRPPALIAVTLACLAAAAPAAAFDTGPHSDITRDALTAEGFGATAVDVANVDNWLVDLYSNAKSIPQSGHSTIGKGLVGSFLGPRENWPDAVVQAAGRSHFDSGKEDLRDPAHIELEWARLMRATRAAALRAKAENRPQDLVGAIGISLHELEDFYSHSDWIEQQGLAGAEGPDWAGMTFGTTPTWFDVPAATRATLNVYIGETAGHPRKHGGWNSDGNRSLKTAVAKDWPGRPAYAQAYMAAYFATRAWVRALRAAVADDGFWGRAQRWSSRGGGALDHDLRGALRIGMMSGHWQGQGEPCNPSWSTSVCGSRNGVGGDLIGLRNATRDYFDRAKTVFRRGFETLVQRVADPQPSGEVLPIASTDELQRTTRFVRLQVLSMRGISLGDPLPLDQADMFSRATIAGQAFQSGEINGRDRYAFPKPNAPFTFLKAVPAGGVYGEPVTSMTVEIRTSGAAFAGTDDDVFLRVGPNLRFPLDKRLYDDFERGDRDTYSVPIDAAARAGLTVGDLRQVQIEKSPDGVAGGWKLRGVRLRVNGREVYARDGIERWLERGNRTWRAPDFRPAAPTGAAAPVTLDLWDEDSFVYGGSDHGDLEPLDMRRTLALGYAPGPTLERRTTGGSALGGRLGDGDRATLVWRLDTLTPVPAALPPPVVTRPPDTPVVAPTPPVVVTPPPAARPDLVITAMDYDPSPSVQYYVTVKNQGAAAAPATTVNVPGDGVVPIAPLAPGASVTTTYSMTCRVGTRTATVDPGGQIDESDETNNTAQYSYPGPCLT